MALGRMTDKQIHDEIVAAEEGFDAAVLEHGAAIAEGWWRDNWSERFKELCDEQAERKIHSSPAVVRLRFLAGETGRKLDAACGEALGWRVDHDEWWNWHPGPVFDPPGDAWCIRRDARNDLPCDEALPSFTAESFDRAINTARKDSEHGND